MYNPQLDTFVAVVENGSFAKAAQALFISTPAVIKKVNALEDRLGLKLLDRTAQGTTLSEVGEVFYEEAKRIIEESHEVLIRLQSMQQEKDGKVIRIGLGYMTSRELLRDVVSVAQREDPELKYRLVTFEMRPDLHRHNLSRLGKDIDFFLVMYDPMRASTLNTLHLSYEPVCCAVSLQHPLAEKDRLTIQGLRGQTMICFRQGYNAFIDQFRNDMRSLYPEIHLKDFSYINEETFNRCANSRDVLFAFPIWRNYHPGVKIIPVDWPYTVPFGLRYSPDAPPAVRKFIDSVKKGWPRNR